MDLKRTLHTADTRYEVESREWVHSVAAHAMSLRDALEAFANDIIEKYLPGFENNDGGGGDLRLDPETGVYRLEHTTYYTESSSEEFVGYSP